jgi:chemotaxis response regulator CheB
MKSFPIVCVGGSAGGLDAYIRLLKCMPADMGVAIVIVNHITKFSTQLHEILPRFTKMPVHLITENLVIEPNHVFIIPSNRDLHVEDEVFKLKPISKLRGWPDMITVLLKSVTENWDGKMIAVIVSGCDGDGAAASCGNKEVGCCRRPKTDPVGVNSIGANKVGGITIAQKPETASQPDMPESAIDTGCIDFVRSLEDIAKKIVSIARVEH